MRRPATEDSPRLVGDSVAVTRPATPRGMDLAGNGFSAKKYHSPGLSAGSSD
jgi:hypothetical protein